MHLNDSFGKEPRLQYVCNHHEQACAIAAEGYARVSGLPGVVNVTTGPGGINALNGVFGAWTDSIPMLVVSGQVKRETCMATTGTVGLRQLGDQEADIVRMVKGITKYAVLVDEPCSMRYHLERAWNLAQSGRPGPCWLDVPMDVQSANVDYNTMDSYNPTEDTPAEHPAQLRMQCSEVLKRIRAAERPVIMIGSGVRLAGAVDLFKAVAEKLAIPVVTAWTAHDCFPSAHPLNCGRPGTIGDRAGNFAVQNADLLIIVGCRLNIRQISYNWKYFARNAFKVQVDIDPAELQKPTVRPDLPIVSDAGRFLQEVDTQLDRNSLAVTHLRWIQWCKERVERYDPRTQYPNVSNGKVNPYGFVSALFEQLADDDVVVCGDGSACVVTFQAATLRSGQRLFTNSGCASMGYDLPAAIGAAFARRGARVVCLAGDGSVHLNIQELQTVKQHNLNLKLFVINNAGYLSIRQTQRAYFGRFVGEGVNSGLSFPDYAAVANAYGLPAMRIEAGDHVDAIIRALEVSGPIVCEVIVDPCQDFEPKLASRVLPDGRMVSSPLEDLAPFLDREELAANMLVPLVDE